MINPRIGLSAGLLFVGAIVAAWYLRAPEETRHEGTATIDASSHTSPESSIEIGPESLGVEPHASLGAQATELPSEEVGSAGVAPHLDQALNPPYGEGIVGESKHDLPWIEDVDPIGIPFPISRSVRRQCESMKDLRANCDEHFGVFSQLATESRDDKWAATSARAIMALVETQDGYSIRALDCRTTVCGVEIEGHDAFDRPAGRRLNPILTRVDRVYGIERNQSNERVIVTSMTFRRR